jgi:hypothetical protein
MTKIEMKLAIAARLRSARQSREMSQPDSVPGRNTSVAEGSEAKNH